MQSLFKPQPLTFTGALIDTRPEEQKKDDIHFKDIVGTANAVDWKVKSISECRRFPEYDQKRSFMCGANALSKAMGIIFQLKYGAYYAFSRAHIYQRRYNKIFGDGAGMVMNDMFKIAGLGVTLESLTGEKITTDYDADSLLIDNLATKVGEAFSISGAVYLPNDIDTVASVIRTTGKGIIFLTYFTSGEWSKEMPTINDYSLTYKDTRALRHFVVGVDYLLYSGMKKGIKIEDSAHFGGLSERILTQEWIDRRVIQAGYPMSFKFLIGSGDRPTYDGQTIISAQKCLKYDGLFPTNISYIENIGPVTRTALKAFQSKYGLNVTGVIDDATVAELRIRYP